LLPAGDRKARPLIDTKADEDSASISPDGKWIACVSCESGDPRSTSRRFPGRAGGFRYRRRAEAPRLAQQRRAFYLAIDDHLMSVPIKTTPTFEAGTPRELFAGQLKVNGYEVAPGGQRFLARFPLPETASKSVRLVLDWPAELKK
jgi:hypothetical protein